MHTLAKDASHCSKEVRIERGVRYEFDERVGVSRTVDFVKEERKVSIRTGEVTGEWYEGKVEREESKRARGFAGEMVSESLVICSCTTYNFRRLGGRSRVQPMRPPLRKDLRSGRLEGEVTGWVSAEGAIFVKTSSAINGELCLHIYSRLV